MDNDFNWRAKSDFMHDLYAALRPLAGQRKRGLIEISQAQGEPHYHPFKEKALQRAVIAYSRA